MLESLLFDLDGLLVDSEPLQFRSYQNALDQFGYTLDLDTWIQWHNVEASTTRWVRDQGLDFDPQALRAVKKDQYDRLIARDLELKPGACELVEKSVSEFALGLVSSSRRDSIERCLQKFDLLRHFSIVVSGAELERSKPYPDAYLEALKLMNTVSENAIALEDSVTGFRAATAARIDCIVCPDYFIPKPADAFSEAILQVESLSELYPARLHNLHDTASQHRPQKLKAGTSGR